tara:strand:+ start:422 stop:895 length:474 start_codon:yes stop_codon:yes gene_type:complete
MSTSIWIVVDEDGTGYRVAAPVDDTGQEILGKMQALVRGLIEPIQGLRQVDDIIAWVNEEGALVRNPVRNATATALAVTLGDPNAPAQTYVGPMLVTGSMSVRVLVTGSDGQNITEVPEYFENFLVGMFAIDWKTDEPISVEECVEYMDAAREEVTA